MTNFLAAELDDATLAEMASAIVHCMNFRAKESTLITAGLHSWGLVELVRIECAKKGVTSTIDLTTDQYARAYLGEMPTDYLRTPPRDLAALASAVDASISISRNWDPNSMRDIPREKTVAHNEGQKEIQAIMQGRGVRRLSAGYPTTPMAQSFGITFQELKELIVGGMLYSQELLLSKCKALASHLSGADRVHLKDSQGTDLIVRIKDRRISMSDGLISEEDQKIGYNTANLPTGEVFIAAHEDFGEGTLFCPLTRDRFTNRVIKNTLLVFEQGRLSLEKTKAEEGDNELKASLTSALKSDERRYSTARTLNIAELGLGLNEKIKKPIGYVLTDEKIGGSAHVAVGDNRSYGGTSDSSIHWDFVTGTREDVTVLCPDGSQKKIVENGCLIVT